MLAIPPNAVLIFEMVLDLKKLNEEQRKAVVHSNGPLLIIAGAGTGKTTVITQRIVYLIEKGDAKTEEILAVTFTEKAAEEMEERVDNLLPFGYVDLWISTFHSFCERILRDHALDIGLPADFKILDDTAGWLLLYRNLDRFELDYYKPLGNPTKFIKALVSHFSHCKDQAIYPEDYLKYADKLKTNLTDLPESNESERIKEVANAYHVYQRLLLENSSLDFGDLINYCLKLFQKRPMILKKYREKFKYILVDEFQDTNWAQYELIKILAEPKNNLTVCADDDQCLPGDTLVDIKGGKKKINRVKIGDLAATAIGKGYLSYAKVKRVFFRRKKARLISFKTKKGYKVQVTDNHKMFCFTPRVSDKKYHYVYLMKRDNVGWRLGTTNDLAVRLKLERSADKILAIKSCHNEEEARFYETLYSLKYGIPTVCFKERDSVMVKGDWMIKLYKEINVERGVTRLTEDLKIDLKAHHYSLDAVTRGSGKRIKINLNMCKRRYKSKYAKNNFLVNPLVYHQVVINTSNKEIIKKLKTAGFNLIKSKKGFQFKAESKDIKKIGEIAEKLQRVTGGILECGFVVGKTNIVSQKALVIPASNVLPGLYLPVITEKKGVIYDQVEKINEETKNLIVYDLEVERTHNFVANGIVVHNSIYKWRGASFSNIIQFKKDFPKAEEISLVKNYRSSQNILDLAYKFIKANDPDRLEYVNKINKKLVAQEKASGIIEHIFAKSLDEEVNKTIKKILEILKRDKDVVYNDFAILVRANDAANLFTKALERAGLPYQFLASKGLYSKPGILDIISYFKLLENYHESAAVYRILNMPFLEIPLQDIIKLTQYSHKRTKSLYEAMEELALIPGISQKTQEKIAFVLSLIKKHSILAREKTVSEILVAFLDDSGYLKYLIKIEAKEQLDLLNQFYKKVKNFEETTIEPSLSNFMLEINLEIESGEEGKLEFDPEQGPDMIKIMTIHGAKGLEFKYVFLVNMVDKRFPTIERKDLIELPENLIKDIKPSGDVHLQEERRICYVAMTRAKKGLYFLSAEDYGGTRKKKLSRFLTEMGYKDKPEIQSPRLAARQAKSENGLLTSSFTKASEGKRKTGLGYLPEHFSFSQLAAFKKCPLQYKFAFILKIPIRGKAMFSFGKTMHNTLYAFLKQANENNKSKQSNLLGFKEKENILGLDSIIEIYEKNWIDEWYENKKQKDEYYKLGKKIVKDFYSEFLKNPPKVLKINNVLALEIPFSLKIGDNTLRGRIDRIDEKQEGAVIIDYKTGNSKEKLALDDKEQLLIYQIAAEEIFKINPKELVYHYLNDNKKASFLGSEKEKNKMKEKIIQEIEGIKKSDFKATPGWQCAFCDFKDICEFAQR